MTAAKRKSSKSKKKTKKRKSRVTTHSARLILSTLFLVVFVGSCLYGLVHLQQHYPDQITPSYVKAPMEEPHIAEPHATTFEDVYLLLEEELLTGASSKGWQRLPGENNVERLQMYGAYPDQRRLMELATKIAFTDGPAQLDLAPRKGHVRLLWNGQLRIELRYNVDEHLILKKPMVAIIMDDMGRSLGDLQTLLNLNIPVTPAILPQADHATKAASFMQEADREYMIHFPMQPKSFPKISPGPNALMLDLSEKELRSRMRQYLRLVPGAVGGNNHMGSLFTQNRDLMKIVLSEIRSNGLFFIDSKTIGNSVAFDQARKMGMRTGVRHIFLDNEMNVTYIRRQLRKMVKIAEEKGEAIAICHPYRETFDALRLEASWLREQPVDFVLASSVALKR